MSESAKAYNKYWREIKGDPARIYMQERVFTTINNLCVWKLKNGLGAKLLDIGCGDGCFVQVCRKHGIDAFGTDISDGVDFERDRLNFRDAEFDTVMLYSVIEHLWDPANILKEAGRVLKPNGTIIIITHNYETSNAFLCARNFFDDPAHVHPYNRISIRKLMKMHSFEEMFMGLWTVCKSPLIWKLPETLQFYCGALLPFKGTFRWAPTFLKGKSRVMLCMFKKK